MMTDEQKSRVVELKVAIAATAGTLSGAPGEVRGAVVELKRDCLLYTSDAADE